MRTYQRKPNHWGPYIRPYYQSPKEKEERRLKGSLSQRTSNRNASWAPVTYR